MTLATQRKRLPLFPNDFYGDMDRFLQNFLGTSGSNEKGISEFRPSWDVTESENAYEIHVELPGLERDQVHIEVVDDSLVIRGEKQIERKSEDKRFHRVERSTGSFERMIRFPTQVDFSQVNATLEKGVLQVHIPKSEQVVPKKIEIK